MRIIIVLIVCLIIVPTASARATLRDSSSARTMRVSYDPMRVLAWDVQRHVPNWRYFRALGRCEQPGDGLWGIGWDTQGRSYPGGLGVSATLWHSAGTNATSMSLHQHEASPAMQMIHAQMVVNKYGVFAWGCADEALAQASIVRVSDARIRRLVRFYSHREK